MLSIKQIDKDHNGYVTRNELDDIIKLNYDAELSDRHIEPFINKFSSISNKILIDYKGFKEWVRTSILDIEAAKINKKGDSKSQVGDKHFKPISAEVTTANLASNIKNI